MLDEVDIAAQIAREIINKIPFAKQENIIFSTMEIGDPSVYYEYEDNCFYQVVNERGTERKIVVAQSQKQMVDYFVYEAIWHYTLSYELRNRHKFESNLRQQDTIMEFCYSFIDPSKKFYRDKYDDEIHIYLDLFDSYINICKKIKESNMEQYKLISSDIDYILYKRYADSQLGGMSDVKGSMVKVQECINRIIRKCPDLKSEFDQYNAFYVKING